MRSGPLRLLLVGDDPTDSALLRGEPTGGQATPAAVERVPSIAAAAEALQAGAFDAVLLDRRLADESSLIVGRLLEAAQAAPVIVLTEPNEWDRAVLTLREGVQDVCVRSDLGCDDLARTIECAIERMRCQDELHSYAAELERANRSLEHFNRVVSHDVKTPLALIHMELSWLLAGSEPMPEKAVRSIREVLKTGEQLRREIDDRLGYSSTGDNVGELDKVDCNVLFQEVLAELASITAETGAQVTADMLPTLWGDRARLTQLFHHLIVNAIRRGGANGLQIHFSAEFPVAEWVFSMADTGPGVSKEFVDHAFEAFARANSPGAAQAGLSLAICKRIVQSHGGRIWLESEVGKGTTVYFSLPNRPAQRPATPDA